MYHDGQGKFVPFCLSAKSPIWQINTPCAAKVWPPALFAFLLTTLCPSWYHSPAKKPATKRLDLFHTLRGAAYQR
jgi:hypothetical protein